MADRVVPGRRAGVAARRKRLAAMGGAMVLLVATVVVATYTPLFGADEIRVEGVATLSADEVAALAGVGEGTNVVHLDTGAVEDALEQDPWIMRATVTRDLPTTIVVHVVERSPVVAAGSEALAEDATVLPGAGTRRLPVLEAVAGELGPDDLRAGAAAAGAMAPPVRGRVASILVEADEDLVLLLDDGVTVFYGAPGEDAEKAEALGALLAWAQGEGVGLASADISVPAAPTARPLGGASTAVP